MEKVNLKWNPLKATILLPINKFDINAKVSSYVNTHGYIMKPEFHVSIIGLQNGKKIIEKYGSDELFLNQIKTLAQDFSWAVGYLEEYFVIEKFYDENELAKSGYENVPSQLRKTIIQKVSLFDMDNFYEKLSALTGLDFDIPFAHITLFAWADYEPMMTQGIGLYSQADFEKYKKDQIF